ncbi:hypothetical protein M3152_13135 [Sporosarcina luteola]|uniref:immunoglobulin-like domain-containing protein n=1 Tax=Bacillales TaxID=1385 RepID=UPI002041D360|nr:MULTISPECIES: immunoglobulin-like domain-containing protein [Bacillales]MCM3638643.1 hypothetical protein [Sporosarcina luteola]
MKKLFILLLALLLLVACTQEPTVAILPDPAPDQEISYSEEGLSLELVESIFEESPAAIHTIVRNDSGQPYRLGEFYHIEMKVDGKWHVITYSDAVFLNNPSFRDFGNILKDGEEGRQLFSVEALGITLIPGDYRLVKTFLSITEPYHEVSVAATFSVE